MKRLSIGYYHCFPLPTQKRNQKNRTWTHLHRFWTKTVSVTFLFKSPKSNFLQIPFFKNFKEFFFLKFFELHFDVIKRWTNTDSNLYLEQLIEAKYQYDVIIPVINWTVATDELDFLIKTPESILEIVLLVYLLVTSQGVHDLPTTHSKIFLPENSWNYVSPTSIRRIKREGQSNRLSISVL